MKDLRFDDGQSYWYPTTIQSEDGMIFPSGESKDDWQWAFAPIEALEEAEKVGSYESKINMSKAKFFKRFLDASKEMNGVDLDELS